MKLLPLTNIVITVPHSHCKDEMDKYCDKKSKQHATELYELLIGNDQSEIKESKHYVHRRSKDVDLLISRTHKLECNLNNKKCAERRPAFLSKLDQIVKFKGEENSIILDVYSFPKNRSMENQMLILYPKGHKKNAEYLKKVLQEFKDYKIKIFPASEENHIVNKYAKSSPMSLILEFPED